MKNYQDFYLNCLCFIYFYRLMKIQTLTQFIQIDYNFTSSLSKKAQCYHFIDLVFTFGFNWKVTFTLQETVTVACEILCCTVECDSTSATPSICPSHSLDSSSCIQTGLPTPWCTNCAISWAFCLALWTARRLACCLNEENQQIVYFKCTQSL